MSPFIAKGLIRSALAAAIFTGAFPLLLAFGSPDRSADAQRSDTSVLGVAAAPMTTTTPSVTPEVTMTVTISPTATITATGVTPTRVTPSSTPTRAPTLPPEPAFLPIAIRDPQCVPPLGNIDVVFVLDGSSYMRKVRRGKTAWEAGQDMIRATVAAMDFNSDDGGQDQAGVLVFRHQTQIHERLELTGSVSSVNLFLGDLEYGSPSDTARMDIALRDAIGVLDRSRMSANRKVLIFVSELQPKNVPYKNEPGCEALDENCTMLKRADEVKGRGIVFAVFATGDDNRGGELLAMASTQQLGLVLPSDEQILSVSQALRPQAPCPQSQFWPYRR